VKNERLAERAEVLGKLFREELGKIESDMIELIRGKGLLNAIVIKPKNGKEAWDVCMKMKELGLLAKPTHQHIIRFAPPLVISEEEILCAASIIKSALEEINESVVKEKLEV
jgi:ornithine--oxo-acid transaminase